MVEVTARPIPRVTHGSVAADELRQYGLTPASVLDFSVNTNPLGPAPSVVRAIAEADWTRYPGDDERPLRQGLAARAGVHPDQVVLGNGSAELLWLLALALLQPGDRAGVVGPTFGEYARSVQVAGGVVAESNAVPTAGGERLLFLCNPNNPTGSFYQREVIEAALVDDPNRVLVLDEAYASLMLDADRWPSEPLLARYPNLVLLRSLTKDHALPGLRLGYLLADMAVAGAVERVRPPWNVNAGALRAGLAALEAPAEVHLARSRGLIAESRALLERGFPRLGFSVAPSRANFLLVRVGDAAEFRRALLPSGLVVRDCASFGLPDRVRVACLRPDHCERLLITLEALRRAH